VTPLPTLTRPSSPLSTTLSLFAEASKDIDRPKEAGLFFFPHIFFSLLKRASFHPPPLFSVRLFLHHATGTGADSNSNPHVNQATLSLSLSFSISFQQRSPFFYFLVLLFDFLVFVSLSLYKECRRRCVKQNKNPICLFLFLLSFNIF
jgi:hypothetical protein